MYRMQTWSVRNARWLSAINQFIEASLLALHPLLCRTGHARLERPFIVVEGDRAPEDANAARNFAEIANNDFNVQSSPEKKR